MAAYQRHVFPLAASTNDEAKAYARTHEVTPTVFTAAEQSCGRGRMGHSFLSPRGGLYTSLLFVPQTAPQAAVRLTVYASVIVAQQIERLTGCEVGIKWVNDLFVNGKKVAGILTEGALNEMGDALRYAIVGIGVNVAHTVFPEELSEIATTLEDACGTRIEVEELERCIADAFFAGDPFAPEIMEEYRRRSFLQGREVTVLRGEERFACRVLDIADDGALVVRLTNGSIRHLSSGEVHVKLSKMQTNI